MLGEEDDLGDFATRLSYQLRRLDVLSMERLYDCMIEIGVPPGRGTALVYIDRYPGCDQAALGRVLGINRASTMATVNVLVGLDAVERRQGRDNRSNALHLTDEGRRLVAEIMQITADHDAHVFATLSERERAELFVTNRTDNRSLAAYGQVDLEILPRLDAPARTTDQAQEDHSGR